MRISAHLPKPNAAEEMFKALPDGKSYDDKFVLGVFTSSGQMIGCADLIRAFPDGETAMLGLLLIRESRQKTGLGRLAYDVIEKIALSWPGIRKVRIGVIGINGTVLAFWRAHGFVETCARIPYAENGVVSETIVLEKALFPTR